VSAGSLHARLHDDEEAAAEAKRQADCFGIADPPEDADADPAVASNGAGQNGQGPPHIFALTDLGNAERLVARHGADIRYVPGIGWHVWDGRRFRRDLDGGVLRRAKLSARAILSEAQEIEDLDKRKLVIKWALASETEPKIRAAVSLAESDLKVIAHAGELDQKPYLLNVENGTLDLSTEGLRAHDRGDLLTKLAPVTWEPGAADQILDRFLAGIFEDRPEQAAELIAYLQRIVGYTLTGDRREERLFFLHGTTNSGKSTLLEAMKAMLGDYALTADFETFLKRRGDTGARNDIARLAGARLVISLEVEEGKQLAEGVIKALVGGDTIAARYLYAEAFEYRPQFALFLAANARPHINASDGAMWRRIDQIPFTNTRVEGKNLDTNVKAHLLTDAGARSALLAWAVAGCTRWQEERLATPAAVRAYTEEYRSENDKLAGWLADACVLDPAATALSSELNKSYTAWADMNRERPISTKDFAAALSARGHTKKHTKAGATWQGVRLAQLQDSAPQSGGDGW
jgi:putative DNA primase/helicase